MNLRTGASEFTLRTGMSAMQSLNADNITSGTIDNQRLPSISKTTISNTGQWLPAEIPNLDALTGTLSESAVPDIAADKITSGTLDDDRIPNLDAAKITSGTLAIDRIPDIPASSVTGELVVSNIPNLDAAKLTSGVLDAARIPATDLLAVTQHAPPSTLKWMPNHLFRTHNMFANNSASFLVFQATDVRDTAGTHLSLEFSATAFPKYVSVLIPQGWKATQVRFEQMTYNGVYSAYNESAQAVRVMDKYVGLGAVVDGVGRTVTIVGSGSSRANTTLSLSTDTVEGSIHIPTSPLVASLVIQIGVLSNPNSVPIYYTGGWVEIEQIS